MKQKAISIFLVLIGFDIILWLFIVFGPGLIPGLYFFNIGQGDSELIIFPGGITMLIDGGPNSSVLKNLSALLPVQDRYLDLVVMSHPQLDHFGGLIDVLKQYEVGAFIGSGRAGTTASFNALSEVIQDKQISYVQLKEGDLIRMGEAVVTVLAPSPLEWESKELNDTALVFLIQTPEYRALYTGDIGANVEARLVRDYNLKANVLKVGHHGSRFSSSDLFLAEVLPDIAVIEVGKNSYGHPTPAALGRLSKWAQAIFRTDQNGLVKIETKNNILNVSALSLQP